MTEMTEPRDLFLHELGDILYAEQHAGEGSSEAEARGLRQGAGAGVRRPPGADQAARRRTSRTAFKALGEKAKAEKCPGIDGIKQEHDEFVEKESPSAEVLDSFLTGAGARTEHYEIAAYEGLIVDRAGDGRDPGREAPVGEPRRGEGGTAAHEEHRPVASPRRTLAPSPSPSPSAAAKDHGLS